VKSEIGSRIASAIRIRMLTLADVSNSESAQLLLRFRRDMDRLDELSIPADTSNHPTRTHPESSHVHVAA
jgi:hypothetical protein